LQISYTLPIVKFPQEIMGAQNFHFAIKFMQIRALVPNFAFWANIFQQENISTIFRQPKIYGG